MIHPDNGVTVWKLTLVYKTKIQKYSLHNTNLKILISDFLNAVLSNTINNKPNIVEELELKN